MRRALLIVLLLTTACASVPRETPEAAVARFVAAFNALDAAAMQTLFAPDATAFLPMPQYGARLDGREAIMAALSPLFAEEKTRSGSLHLTQKGLHIQTYGSTAVATFDVGTEAVYSRRTLVLRARGGRWEIVHLHASNVRP
ncbi:MAG TPA: nuclear transport factor 2 family protein [Thermoanaerobaculia bacterium]|jgi:uncharacterized protein (TIGR02246 family)